MATTVTGSILAAAAQAVAQTMAGPDGMTFLSASAPAAAAAPSPTGSGSVLTAAASAVAALDSSTLASAMAAPVTQAAAVQPAYAQDFSQPLLGVAADQLLLSPFATQQSLFPTYAKSVG